MPNTTLGYPYPNPSDPVADAAAAIQALAQDVDDELGMMKCGRSTINAVNVATDYTAGVTFAGTAFPGIPKVTACLTNKANPANYEPVTISALTSTGFTINVRRSAGTASMDVDWIAVYQ
jgi:hypothetical protein